MYNAEKNALILFKKYKSDDVSDDFLQQTIKILTTNIESILKEYRDYKTAKKLLAEIATSQDDYVNKLENRNNAFINLMKLFHMDQIYLKNNITSDAMKNFEKSTDAYSILVTNICFNHFTTVISYLLNKSNKAMVKQFSIETGIFPKPQGNKRLGVISESDEKENSSNKENENSFRK